MFANIDKMMAPNDECEIFASPISHKNVPSFHVDILMEWYLTSVKSHIS